MSKDNDNHHAPPRQIVFDEELQELILLSVLCEGDVQGSQNSQGKDLNAKSLIFLIFSQDVSFDEKLRQGKKVE